MSYSLLSIPCLLATSPLSLQAQLVPAPARYSLLKFLTVLSTMEYGTSIVIKESDVNSIGVEQGEVLRIVMR